jgi:membrane protein insertase Oxa1/YidC/SpoIIIJ
MLYVLPGFLTFWSYWFPAALQLVLLFGTFFGVLSGKLLRSPTVRRWLRMVPAPPPKPLVDLEKLSAIPSINRRKAAVSASAAPEREYKGITGGFWKNIDDYKQLAYKTMRETSGKVNSNDKSNEAQMTRRRNKAEVYAKDRRRYWRDE